MVARNEHASQASTSVIITNASNITLLYMLKEKKMNTIGYIHLK